MDIFRDLYITTDADRMAAVADRVDRSPPDGWTRDRTTEARARVAPLPAGPTFCFTNAQAPQRPAATLVLSQKDSTTFFVSNIVPLTKHQLARGEYNAILEDFFERVIQQCTGADGIRADLSGAQADLEHWMSSDTAALLRQFSACANKGREPPSRTIGTDGRRSSSRRTKTGAGWTHPLYAGG